MRSRSVQGPHQPQGNLTLISPEDFYGLLRDIFFFLTQLCARCCARDKRMSFHPRWAQVWLADSTMKQHLSCSETHTAKYRRLGTISYGKWHCYRYSVSLLKTMFIKWIEYCVTHIHTHTHTQRSLTIQLKEAAPQEIKCHTKWNGSTMTGLGYVPLSVPSKEV